MSTKLHNRIQTHIDPYEGEIITTDGKPPVNAKLTNFKMYGKSVQSGAPTPESPVPINSVAHNTSITSCGKNQCLNYWSNLMTTGIIYNDKQPSIILNENTKYATVWAYLDVGSHTVSVNGNFQFTINRISHSGNPCIPLTRDIPTTINITKTGWVGLGIERDEPATGTDIPIGANKNPGDFGFQIERGLLATGYIPYIGSTTNLNLIGAPNAPAEWVGQPISLMSLTDGTADEYRADEGVVIKRVKKEILNGGVSESWVRGAYATYDRGDYKMFMNRKADGYLKYQALVISSRFESKDLNVGSSAYANCIFPYGEANISYGFPIKIDKNLLSIDWDNSTDEQRITAFRTWLASNNVEVVYALNEPITIPVVPQPTPKSVYAHLNNIYADSAVQPTISCGVRKLGNRPFIPAKLKDELGNFLVDENGNNIGGLY